VTSGEVADFRVLAEDGDGRQIARDYRLIIDKVIAITTPAALPDGTVGASYDERLQASGGTPPYGWELESGQLPTGLALNPQTGQVLGVALRAGTFAFRIRVRDTQDAAGQVSVAQDFTLTVR